MHVIPLIGGWHYRIMCSVLTKYEAAGMLTVTYGGSVGVVFGFARSLFTDDVLSPRNDMFGLLWSYRILKKSTIFPNITYSNVYLKKQNSIYILGMRLCWCVIKDKYFPGDGTPPSQVALSSQLPFFFFFKYSKPSLHLRHNNSISSFCSATL